MNETDSEIIEESGDTKKKVLLGVGTAVVVIFCLLAIASPDGKSLDKRLRNELKQGTQLKDIAQYCKENNMPYEWNPKARRLTIVLPGASWLPLAKATYRENLYFDNFNRFKGLSGGLVYGMR
jgi:hypothetical protein